ncbi:MAG: cupin domain-containing protein [Cyclobacteriaceae bacterium]
MSAQFYIDNLHLQPHPEGGYFKENYRSKEILTIDGLPQRFSGDRNISTAIYYLLKQGDYSGFHKIKSDECWHFYAGSTMLLHMIDAMGKYSCIHLGKELNQGEVFQFVVPAGTWFASEPARNTEFCLMGCTVAPGFDFQDFEMAKSAALSKLFPEHSSIIERLCR